jgi:serine/threonine protein phosphatase PrpC
MTRTSAGPLQAAFRSDPGRVRSNNEDVPVVDVDRGIFGVIDGVGGQAAGELAAAIACDVILQRLARPLGTPAERVREAIAIANNEIFARAQEAPGLQGMTCVVTLALVNGSTVTIGHVGDSRLYAIGPAGLVKITRDHSPVGEREDAGEISEAEAMRHPRRNEVFRDVGSAHRDKDEAEYVEVSEIPFDSTSALLLCTDGLTDMLPAAAIERIVRQFAGDPPAVVDALVTAANEAGGRDNVTVVYAEAPDFAKSFAASPAAGTQASTPGRDHLLVRGARAVIRSRLTWFAAGAAAGVLATLGLVWRAPSWVPLGNRTLVVASAPSATFPTIASAMLAARPGDVVELEPGMYAERVVVPGGVSLVARVPGTASLVRPPGTEGEYVALTATGEGGGRISGLRVESTTEAPVDVAMRVSGDGRTIEQSEIAGAMRTGVELLDGSSASLHTTRFTVQGHALTIGDGAQALVTGNVFLRAGRAGGPPPIALGGGTQTTLRENVFAGFGTDIVKGYSATERQQIAAANVIVAADPATR